MSIYFTINEKPVAKARPRTGRFGIYTPQKTKQFEQIVALKFKSKYPNHKLIDYPISLEIVFYYPPPKHWSQEKKYSLCCKATKPDIDNLIKSVLDGMNNVVYTDDKLIYKITASKYYYIDFCIHIKIF